MFNLPILSFNSEINVWRDLLYSWTKARSEILSKNSTSKSRQLSSTFFDCSELERWDMTKHKKWKKKVTPQMCFTKQFFYYLAIQV